MKTQKQIIDIIEAQLEDYNELSQLAKEQGNTKDYEAYFNKISALLQLLERI